jgi:hypothetical protein
LLQKVQSLEKNFFKAFEELPGNLLNQNFRKFLFSQLGGGIDYLALSMNKYNSFLSLSFVECFLLEGHFENYS